MIYLDSNATTPVLPEVREAMRPFLTEVFGNPASAHQAGRRARKALEDAREKVAALLDAFPDEVIFTSGATEANNLALFGLAGQPPGHLLASPVEHPCVLEPLRQLEARGFSVEWLPVDAEGVVAADTVRSRKREDTRLV
jgi:cysteine desulfurase